MSDTRIPTPTDLEELGIPEVTLGWRLQMALAKVDMQSADMADELGVHRATVSRWMNERGAPPKTAYIKQWAIRCGVDYEWLATGLVDLTRFDGPGTTNGQVIDASGWFSRTAGHGRELAATGS